MLFAINDHIEMLFFFLLHFMHERFYFNTRCTGFSINLFFVIQIDLNHTGFMYKYLCFHRKISLAYYCLFILFTFECRIFFMKGTVMPHCLETLNNASSIQWIRNNHGLR